MTFGPLLYLDVIEQINLTFRYNIDDHLATPSKLIALNQEQKASPPRHNHDRSSVQSVINSRPTRPNDNQYIAVVSSIVPVSLC